MRNVPVSAIVCSRRAMRLISVFLLLTCISIPAVAAEKYTGPRPPKADVPYLLHADNLVETEIGAASTENRKDNATAVINGANSPVKTPLSEPIFIIRTDRLQADRFEVYRLESKDGKREVSLGNKKGKKRRPARLPEHHPAGR